LLAAIQSQVGAAHSAHSGQLAGAVAGFEGDLSVGASGPVSTAHLPAHSVLGYLPAGSPASASPAGAPPFQGLDGQQQQQLHLSAAAGGHSSSGGRDHRVGWSPLGPLGQFSWGLGAPRQLPLTPRAAQHSTPGSEAAECAWCDCEPSQAHCPHAGSSQAAGMGSVRAAQHSDGHTGRGIGGSSSGGSASAVQLGAGSHLYPACSPGRHSCSSCCCPQHGDCTCAASAAAMWPGALECAHRDPAVQHSSSRVGSDRPAGGSLCAALDVREYQQSAAPPTWRQLQSPLLSPSWRCAGADVGADAARQHVQADQHVLPGIAQLLQRRGEQHHHTCSSSSSQQVQRQRGVSSPTALPDGSTGGLPWASCSSAGLGAAADAHPTAAGATGCWGDQSRDLGVPVAADGRCSSDGGSDGSPPKRSRIAAAAQRGECETGQGCGATTIAELLWDKGFVVRVLRTLPGVDPQSQLVWDTVAELQQALLHKQDTGAASPLKQLQ
jgi:hypothetical protein